MADYVDDRIALAKLVLDANNPRHPQLESQQEILHWMTHGSGNAGNKLYALAKHIAMHGLDPSSRPICIPSPDDEKRYVVLEGNRRLTALRLLNNPQSAPSEVWRKRYTKLKQEAEHPIPGKIPCVIYKDADKAFEFIELKHLGEAEGAGVVGWDSEQKSRHEIRRHGRSRNDRALILLDHIKSSELYPEETKSFAESFRAITTLARILQDKEFRDFLGLDSDESGELRYKIEPTEAAKAITKVVNDFGSGQKKVESVINKKARTKYRAEFSQKEIPDHRQILDSPAELSKALGAPTSKNTPSATSKQKSYQHPDIAKRKVLVLPGTSIPISGTKYKRHRQLFNELRTLPIREKNSKFADVFPNAAGLLIRTFIELSIETLIQEKSIPSPSPNGWTDIPLVEKIKQAKAHLLKNSQLESKHDQVLNKFLSNKHHSSNPNILNGYVHNDAQIPTAKELGDIWDDYTPLLVAIWQAVK